MTEGTKEYIEGYVESPRPTHSPAIGGGTKGDKNVRGYEHLFKRGGWKHRPFTTTSP